MRAADAKMIRLLRTAAMLIRRADTPALPQGHRFSETDPSTCARCGGAWPCAHERNARVFDRAADEHRQASRRSTHESIDALARQIRALPDVAASIDSLINKATHGEPSLDYIAPIRQVLTAARQIQS